MRFLILLPTLVMGLVVALSTGYWQALGYALVGLVVQGSLALKPNREAATESSQVQVFAGAYFVDGRRLSRLLRFWTKLERRLVFEFLTRGEPSDQAFQSASVSGASARLPVLGFTKKDLELEPLFLDWSARAHTLIVGPTGSGKSALIAKLLDEFHRLGESAEVLERIVLIDLKDSHTANRTSKTLEKLAALPEASVIVVPEVTESQTDASVAAAALLARVSDSLHHDAEPAEVRQLVIIEELSSLLANSSTVLLLQELLAKGRTAGVRLVVTNQTASGIPRSLLVNLQNRILLAEADETERVLLGASNPSNRPLKAAASQVHRGPERPGERRVFQGCLLDPERTFYFQADWS